MTNERLRIAVVSDMHCLYKNADTPSGITYLYSNAPQNPVARHPVYALLKLLENNQHIRADILICPGDIADKADEQGLLTGWEYLKKIKAGLGAANLWSTVGNHDVDSRRTRGYTSAFQYLQDFSNDYPLDGFNEKYWSKKYVIIEHGEAQVLILNTCHNHASKDDANQSIITPTTLQEIEDDLSKLPIKKYRFAFCHHHPIKHSNIDIQYKDGDVIDNGDKLVSLLEKHDFQILVHGHKHDPRLEKSKSLTIFAAGSFSSLQNIKELGANNCFHIIELLPNQKCGIIKSWVYVPPRGWEVKKDTEFPCVTGFGNTKTVEILATECLTALEAEEDHTIPFSKLLQALPELEFLIPEEQIRLNTILRDKYNLALVPELPNRPRLLTNVVYE